MKFRTACGRFWYDLIIGDDPKIAGAVVLDLVTAALIVDLRPWRLKW